MTGWTLFFIIVGVAFLTAQFFRLIDLIERRPAAWREDPAWNARPWDGLDEKPWTSSRS